MFPHADSEDSDQTGQMHWLIWVFAGRTCHFVGFVMRQLKMVFVEMEILTPTQMFNVGLQIVGMQTNSAPIVNIIP